MTTIRLTMAQALVKYLAALRVEMEDGSIEHYCGGVFTIFGHGNAGRARPPVSPGHANLRRTWAPASTTRA